MVFQTSFLNRKVSVRVAIIVFLILILVVGILSYQTSKVLKQIVVPFGDIKLLIENQNSSIVLKKNEPETILFVGDIMLDQEVENLMKENDIFYPFQKISQFLEGNEIVFGNLEGPIVESPKQFSKESLMFAFSPKVTDALSSANFTLLSLANNHTFNMGQKGLEETREFLKEKNIIPIGDPQKCDENFSFQKENFLILAFNKVRYLDSQGKLNSPCQDKELIAQIESARASNPFSFIIVSIHWGKEYTSTNSSSQIELAHKIIDAGADLIMGYHPHVVQNIEIYKEKLIFYSLGIFVFDLYFSKETQQGLAVELEIQPERLVSRLFPIQSKLSQPFLMEETEAKDFLEKLAQKSSSELFEQIRGGIIEIEK